MDWEKLTRRALRSRSIPFASHIHRSEAVYRWGTLALSFQKIETENRKLKSKG